MRLRVAEEFRSRHWVRAVLTLVVAGSSALLALYPSKSFSETTKPALLDVGDPPVATTASSSLTRLSISASGGM